MPRSDGGRAATAVALRHGGGLRDAPRLVIQAFRIEEEPLRHETFDWRFPHGPVAPRRRWLRDRRPCAIARPSSAEEGNQNVQSPSDSFASDVSIVGAAKLLPFVVIKP